MRKRRTTKRTAIAACGALLLVFLALALFFSLLVPDYSFAQREEEVTNVNFIITMDHEGGWPGSMGVVPVFIGEEITVDSKWAAHAEASYTAEDVFPVTQSQYAIEGGWECELKGDYSYGRKELTGTIKVSGEYQEPTTTLTQTENFEGTLKLSFNRDPMVAKEPPYESTDSYWFDYDNPIGTGKITGKEEISYVRGEQVGSSSNDISVNVEAYILVGGEKTGTTEGDGEEGQESEGGDQKSGGGSKVPGPGSWWEWLTGTALAGAVAAGAGLISTLFGETPPLPPDMVAAPPIPPSEPPLPPPPDQPRVQHTQTLRPDRPPTDFEIYGDPYSVYIVTQTLKNAADDIKSIPGALQEGFNNLMDKALWVRSKVKDIDSMNKSLKELQGMVEEKGRADKDALQGVISDPQKAVKELGDKNIAWVKSTVEELKKNPLGIIKAILGIDWWKNAMDHTKPILERLGYATVATLNTVGIFEGLSGLKNWVLGEGAERAAGRALVPKQLPRQRNLIKPAGKLSEADLSKVRTVRATGQKAFFDNLGKAEKGKLKSLWKSDLYKAESRIKSFKNAMKAGDIESQTKAILDIQRDPLAIQKLNVKDKRVIKSFNKQLGKIQNNALESTKQQIAQEYGVSPNRVEVFKATNPRASDVRVKTPMDQDLTIRVTNADGTAFDVPAPKVQKIYDENFYEAAGRPKGTTPAQLGKDCRNVAVDSHSAEAFGMKPDDWDAMQLGKSTSHTDTIARTMEFKPNEALARADDLAKSGDLSGALKERYLGQRETVKSFNNQVKGRVEHMKGQANPEKLAVLNEQIADVEGTVREMDRMIAQGASPVKVDDFLRSRGTTAEDLAKKVADIYRGLTP